LSFNWIGAEMNSLALAKDGRQRLSPNITELKSHLEHGVTTLVRNKNSYKPCIMTLLLKY